MRHRLRDLSEDVQRHLPPPRGRVHPEREPVLLDRDLRLQERDEILFCLPRFPLRTYGPGPGEGRILPAYQREGLIRPHTYRWSRHTGGIYRCGCAGEGKEAWRMGYGRGLHGLRCPGSWRQGRGNKFPLPVGPTPRGDIHTVHSMGRPWRRAGHDCPPDIATHGPRPVGAGEERRRRGWGGGGRRGIRVSASEGTDGVEAADRSAWVSLAAGVGGVEAASRSVWYPPAGVGGVLE